MKASTLPVICTCALTAMSAAGFSHWWSIHQLVASMGPGLIRSAAPASQRPTTQPAATPRDPQLKAPALATTATPQPTAVSNAQKAFYEAMLAKMEGLQNQNRDLLDQLAETNRDLMKLEFRVDTHSESFRPMPVSEDRPYTSNDDEPGVLPPRAEPVVFPTRE